MRALVKKKLELESERGVYQCEADFLVSYGRSLQSEHVTPKDFEAFLKSFVDQGKRNSEHVHQINTKIEELEKLIEEEEKKENDDHSDVAKVGTQHGQVWVTLVTDSDVKAEMKITYSMYFRLSFHSSRITSVSGIECILGARIRTACFYRIRFWQTLKNDITILSRKSYARHWRGLVKHSAYLEHRIRRLLCQVNTCVVTCKDCTSIGQGFHPKTNRFLSAAGATDD